MLEYSGDVFWRDVVRTRCPALQIDISRKPVKIPKYHRGAGCKHCRSTGYTGQIALHELLIADEEIKEMINERVTPSQLRARAIEKGMVPLAVDGIEKVKAGIISIEEVLRTVQLENG